MGLDGLHALAGQPAHPADQRRRPAGREMGVAADPVRAVAPGPGETADPALVGPVDPPLQLLDF